MYKLTENEKNLIKNCQFKSIYSLFGKHMPRARVLTAPEEFRQYLLADGIWLAEDDDDLLVPKDEYSSDSDKEDEAALELKDNSVDSKARVPEFFHNRIKNTIKELHGAVCPKLNWSSPKDATWILPTNSMKCYTPNEIYMLLKSSDYCTHDLTQALGDGDEPETLQLVLREWFDCNKSLEFRCFIKNGHLIGCTQRDMVYYEFLEEAQAQIIRAISNLCKCLIADYPDPCFVADVYVKKSYERAYLIDINPWLERTDSLLFSWDELYKWDRPFELRLLDKACSTINFNAKEHSANHVPHDLVDMPRENIEELVSVLRDMAKLQEKEAA